MSTMSLNVNITSSAPHNIGANISFEAIIQPATSGLMYIWLDNNGTLLGMGINQSTLTIPISDGPFERVAIVNVIQGTQSHSGSVRYTVQYAPEAVIPPTIYSAILRPQNNLELHRWLSYMPSWSFAGNSHLSNYAKLTGFSYNTLTNVASKPILFSATNLKGAIDTIDYPANQYIYNLAKHPKQIKTNLGIFENIGPDEYASFDSYPITNCFLQEGSIVDFSYEYNTDTDFERFTIPKESYLYLTLTDNVEADVVIVGLDAKGNLVKDRKTLMPRISHKTINKYKIVIGIYSQVSFDISTLSKSDSYRTDYIDFKRITDRSGNYFEPFFAVDYIDPTVISAKKLDNSDVYKFRTDREIDKFAVTENLDLIFVSAEKLYAAKLHFDISQNIGINSTFNNNAICSTQYDDVMDGEKIIFIIDVAKIAELSTHFKIKLENDGNVFWYDGNGNAANDKFTISTNGSKAKIQISKQKLNNKPYILSVSIENVKEVFQCGVIDNIITSYKLADDVYDLSIYGGNIYCHSLTTASQRAAQNNDYEYHSKLIDDNNQIINTSTSTETIFKLVPVRACYTTNDKGIVLWQKVDIEEIIYE
jgi:hypothetical protein